MKHRGDCNLMKRHQHRFNSVVILAVIFHVIYPILNPLNLNAEDYPGNSTVSITRNQVALEKTIAVNQDWFNSPAFKNMIQTHDQFLPEFTRWRALFARHADTIARLIKTFPNSGNLSEDHLRQIVANPEKMFDSLENKNVFAPWTNRWSGKWSNGAAQYHIWDTTRIINGRMIQPVTLSENSFINACCVERNIRSRNTDIAINLYSRQYGITGWVSKNQHQRIELPHIGYLVNDSTLLWICQIKSPGELSAPGNRWFVFLETVNNSAIPREYHIFGQPVFITETFGVEASEYGMHHGVYYSTKAPTARSLQDGADKKIGLIPDIGPGKV